MGASLQEFDLTGRTAIVTGGNGGIGKGIATGLARAGANVVIAARDETKTAGTLEELTSAGYSAAAVRCDVAVDGDAERAVQFAVEHRRLRSAGVEAPEVAVPHIVRNDQHDVRPGLRMTVSHLRPEPSRIPIVLSVPDIKAAHARALTAGCSWLDARIRRQPTSERGFALRDPFGNALVVVEEG